MSHAITVHVPESFFQPLTRVAQAAHQPIEELLLTALQASFPPLAGLPDDIVENLSALETLPETDLRRVMLEVVPAEQAKALHVLLARQQGETLEAAAQIELAQLQHQADLVMLRKARAAVLLRFRGKPIPTAAELRQLSNQLS
jgi:hypothetical protein